MIYQCSIEEEYEDTSLHRWAYNVGRQGTAGLRSVPEVRTVDDTECISYLKSLMYKDALISLPSGLVNLCRDTACPQVGPGSLAQIFESVLAVPRERSWNPGLQMFRVVNCWPEHRHNIPLHHIEALRTAINVVFCSVVEYESEHSNVLATQSSSEIVSLNLRGLCADVSANLSQICKWMCKKTRATPALGVPLPDSIVVGPGVVDALPSILPPEVGQPAPQREPSLDIVPMSKVDMKRNADDVIARLVFAGAVQENAMVYWSECVGDISMEVLSTLAHAGAVHMKQDDFGQMMLACKPESIAWSLTRGLVAPLPICVTSSQRPTHLKTKFELLIDLQCDGWVASDDAPAPLVPDGQRRYRFMGWREEASARLLGVPSDRGCDLPKRRPSDQARQERQVL